MVEAGTPSVTTVCPCTVISDTHEKVCRGEVEPECEPVLPKSILRILMTPRGLTDAAGFIKPLIYLESPDLGVKAHPHRSTSPLMRMCRNTVRSQLRPLEVASGHSSVFHSVHERSSSDQPHEAALLLAFRTFLCRDRILLQTANKRLLLPLSSASGSPLTGSQF